MYLKEILPIESKLKFKRITLNSNNVKKNDLFIAYPPCENTNQYIKEALDKKCSCVITNHNYSNELVFKRKNLEKEIIDIFNVYYHYPLENKNLIGVTGTDGKTTIASILKDLLKCPSIGTNGFQIDNNCYPLNNTTPRIDTLYECFFKCKDYQNIVMEVSSEAYLTKRIGQLPFTIGILTNITKDHLDKHKSLINYIYSKLELFKHSKISILNRDSKYYNLFKRNSIKSLSYGFSSTSDLRILKYKLYFDHSIIKVQYQNKKYTINYPLLGKFNVYNIACCILTLLSLNYEIEDIIKRISYIKPVIGRMNIIYDKEFKVILDYAHTEDSTKKVLTFFRQFNKNIITVVGCAGDRYKEKRKKIGRIVLKYSKFVVFTSDDPRYENPNDIIKEMISNSKKKNYFVIENRKLAIKKAINLCKKDFIILILGKGMDNYMAIENKKIPYSDFDSVFDILDNI